MCVLGAWDRFCRLQDAPEHLKDSYGYLLDRKHKENYWSPIQQKSWVSKCPPRFVKFVPPHRRTLLCFLLQNLFDLQLFFDDNCDCDIEHFDFERWILFFALTRIDFELHNLCTTYHKNFDNNNLTYVLYSYNFKYYEENR